MNRSLALVSVVTILLSASLAHALPAPMSEADMLKAADLVVDAKCVTIVCEGKPIDDGKKIITTYKSTLWPSKGYKGSLPKSFHIKGQEWKWKGTPPVGGWHQGAVAKDWAGKLYLKKLPDGSYTKVWWNATTEDTTTSKPQPLPLCSGDAGPPPDANVPDKMVPDTKVMSDLMPYTDNFFGDTGKPDTVSGPDLKQTPKHEGMPVEGGAPKKDGTVSADGGQAGDDADEGCSCAVSSKAGAPTLLLLALLGLVWLGRRKAGR